jgi:hypothetical protein
MMKNIKTISAPLMNVNISIIFYKYTVKKKAAKKIAAF